MIKDRIMEWLFPTKEQKIASFNDKAEVEAARLEYAKNRAEVEKQKAEIAKLNESAPSSGVSQAFKALGDMSENINSYDVMTGERKDRRKEYG